MQGGNWIAVTEGHTNFLTLSLEDQRRLETYFRSESSLLVALDSMRYYCRLGTARCTVQWLVGPVRMMAIQAAPHFCPSPSLPLRYVTTAGMP